MNKKEYILKVYLPFQIFKNALDPKYCLAKYITALWGQVDIWHTTNDLNDCLMNSNQFSVNWGLQSTGHDIIRVYIEWYTISVAMRTRPWHEWPWNVYNKMNQLIISSCPKYLIQRIKYVKKWHIFIYT